MRVNFKCCLFVFILGSNIKGLIYETVQENQPVVLRCRRSVKGEVTWSRESAGRKVTILTAYGSWHIKHNDPFRRYTTFADRSLYIQRAAVSDSGRYLCNNEEAVELTVIPSERKTPPQIPPPPPPPPPPPSPPPPPPSPTKQTTTPQTTAAVESPASAYLWHIPVRTVIGLLYVIIMISITVVTWRKALQIQKQKQNAAEEGNDL